MRASYLAQDRPDVNEATTCLARRMKDPRDVGWQDLKRLIRYLVGRPRMVTEFKPQKMPKRILVSEDGDHAGCPETGRSTSGMVARFGRHVVKHSSHVQSTIALSAGESEYYSVVKGAAVGFALQALLEDWHIYKMAVELESDSTSAKGTTDRMGLGKLRHVRTRYLWVQERVSNAEMVIHKVPTNKNISDMLTKAVSRPSMDKHLATMGQIFPDT